MKNKFAVLGLVLALVFTMAACNGKAKNETGTGAAAEGQSKNDEKTTYSVGITVQDISNATWAAQINEIKSECEAMGWTVTATQHDSDAAKAITQIENYITTGCDFIICQISFEDAVADVLQTAKDAGICVIGDGVPLEVAHMNYMNDNHGAGYLGGIVLGNWFNDNFGKDHKAIIAQMTFDHPLVNARTDGQLEGLASVHPNYTVIANGHPRDAASAMNDTENMLTAHPEIEAITNWGDSMALGTLETARAMGYTAKNLAIISIDGTQEALAEIAAGSSFIGSTSLGGPAEQGADMVKMMLAYIEGTNDVMYYSPNICIDASNVNEYLK